MNQRTLTEYRCACGKLLFRGLLLLSVVEVKCKRCGALKIFKAQAPENTSIPFVLLLKKDGRIADVCQAGEFLLLYPRKALLEMSVGDLCPLVRDYIADLSQSARKGSNEQEVLYQIRSNVFFLRDGGRLSAESYLLSGKSPDEYQLINICFGSPVKGRTRNVV